ADEDPCRARDRPARHGRDERELGAVRERLVERRVLAVLRDDHSRDLADQRVLRRDRGKGVSHRRAIAQLEEQMPDSGGFARRREEADLDVHEAQWYVRESVRMDPSATGSALVIFVLLLLVNAFFVAAEYAFVRVRGTQLQEQLDAGSLRARKAMRILASLDSYISAIQLGVTLAALGIGLVGEPVIGRILEPVFAPLGAASPVLASVVAFLVAFAIVTYCTVVIAELAPKYLALERALGLALWTAYPLDLFHSLMRPFIYVINRSAFAVLRVFGVRPGAEAEAHSAEELRILIATSTRKGILQESERVLVANALDFAETLVRQVMV